MMIPEAWENHESDEPDKRAFYRFHASLMEPWDGPASIAFTDGTVMGAVLDRNGLRPSRYWVTDDGLVIMASEAGVLDVPSAEVVKKGRLEPGRMFLVDTALGRIVDDEEIKSGLAAAQPYREWLDAGLIHLDDLPARDVLTPVRASQVQQQRMFGWTEEEVRILRRADGAHRGGADRLHGHRHADRGALGSAADAVRLLLAAVRAGHEPAARRDPRGARHEPRRHDRARGEPARSRPGVVSPDRAAVSRSSTTTDLAKLRYIDEPGGVDGYQPITIDALYPVAGGGDGLRDAIESIRRAGERRDRRWRRTS